MAPASVRSSADRGRRGASVCNGSLTAPSRTPGAERPVARSRTPRTEPRVDGPIRQVRDQVRLTAPGRLAVIGASPAGSTVEWAAATGRAHELRISSPEFPPETPRGVGRPGDLRGCTGEGEETSRSRA